MGTVNLFFLLDVSGTMSENGRIERLNSAVPEALKNLNKEAITEEFFVNVRVIEFSDEAHYLYGSPEKGVPAKDVVENWKALAPKTTTKTYKAIEQALLAMHTNYLIADGCMDHNICAPVVILFTDGITHEHDKYLEWIDRMKNTRQTRRGHESILRIAIGVYEAADSELEEFASVWPTVVRDASGNETIVEKKQVYHVDDGMDFSGIMSNLVVSSVNSSLSTEDEDEEVAPINPYAKKDEVVEAGMSTDFSDFL